jgi:hypothetical protein
LANVALARKKLKTPVIECLCVVAALAVSTFRRDILLSVASYSSSLYANHLTPRQLMLALNMEAVFISETLHAIKMLSGVTTE